MGKTTPANPDPARPLPERANLEHLKNEIARGAPGAILVEGKDEEWMSVVNLR